MFSMLLTNNFVRSKSYMFRVADNLAPVVSPLALEVVTRIDRIFDIERGICGKIADERLAVRQELTTPLVNDLEHWLREKRAMLARHTPVAVAIGYMLKDWTAFTRFLADGRICLTNNAAERALRGIACGSACKRDPISGVIGVQ